MARATRAKGTEWRGPVGVARAVGEARVSRAVQSGDLGQWIM